MEERITYTASPMPPRGVASPQGGIDEVADPLYPPPLPLAHLTSQQRMVVYVLSGIANDLDRGTKGEQHTAALLRLAADAVERTYEAELVALARAWRREREAEDDGQATD